MIFKTLLTSVAVSMAVASYAQAAIQDGTFEGTANGKKKALSPLPLRLKPEKLQTLKS